MTTVLSGVFIWGTLVPEAVPGDPNRLVATIFGVQAPLAVMFAGLVLGISFGSAVFWAYFRYAHPDEIVSETSELTAMFDDFFYPNESGQAVRDEWATLPPKWERRMYQIGAAIRSFVPSIVAIVAGLVGVVVNLFYPIPEVVLFVGLIGHRFLPDRWREGPRGRHRFHLFDARFLDSISAASRNLKGFVMVLFAAIGSLLSAGLYLVLLAFSVGAITTIVSSGFVTETPSTAIQWFGIIGALLLLATVFVSLLLVGPYSILHWVRQFERIEAYARYWESKPEPESPEAEPTTAVVRPPGLLLPAHGPLIVLLVLAVISETLLPQTVLAGAVMLVLSILVFAGAAGVMILGWRWTLAQSTPQPLVHEDRDLLLTLLIHVAVVAGLTGVRFDPLGYDPTSLVLTGLVSIILGVLMYSPDEARWMKDVDGPRRFLWKLPSVVAIVCLWLLGEVAYSADLLTITPVAIQVLAVCLGILSFGVTGFGLYLDRQSEA